MNALSKLKVNYITGLSASPVLVHKLIHRRSEIILACLLTQAYASFGMMMLHRSLAMQGNNSYEEAEKTANMFGSLFALEIKPEDMLHDCDDCTNKALDEYNTMCSFLKTLESLGYDRADVMAFCKQVEYGSELSWFKVEANLHYKFYTDALFAYLTDGCSYEQLVEQFFEVSIFTKERSPAKVWRFIRNMRKALDLFYEVTEKRASRGKRKADG